MGENGRYQLLFDEAMRQLEGQQRELDQVRARASSLVAATALATTFLGANLVRKGQFTLTAWIATGFFALAVGIAAWTAASAVRGWCFGFDARLTYERWLVRQPELSLAEMQLELVYRLSEAIPRNDRHLRYRQLSLILAGAALVCEIVSWLVDLINS